MVTIVPMVHPLETARTSALARASATASSRSGATTAAGSDTENDTPFNVNSSPATSAALSMNRPTSSAGIADVQRVRRHVGPIGLVEPQVEAGRAEVLVAGAGVAQGADEGGGPLVDDRHRRLGRRAAGLHAEGQRSPIGPSLELAVPVTVTVLTTSLLVIGVSVAPGAAVSSPGSLF